MKNKNNLIVEIQNEIGAFCGVQDGIIDINLYSNAKYKILWVLKEAYDPKFENDDGDRWDLRKELRGKKSINCFEGAVRMYENMTYVSWGILNNFPFWKNISYVKDDPTMLNSLKSTAYTKDDKVDLIKCMVGFWIAQMAAIIGLYIKAH